MAVAFLLTLGPGVVHLSPAQTLAGLFARRPNPWGAHLSPLQLSVLWSLRLPRAVTAACVGAASAMAGVVLQGLFRDPALDTSVTGSSSVAALAAGGAVAAMSPWQSRPALCLLAGCAVAVAAAYVTQQGLYHTCRPGARGRVVFALAGVGLNATAATLAALMALVAPHLASRADTAWRWAAFYDATWPRAAAVGTALIVSAWPLARLARGLDATILGDAEAQHLGVDPQRTRRAATLWVALLAGTSVAAAGILPCLGFVAPALARRLVGARHHLLLGAAACTGASLVLVADLVGRTVAAPTELPAGLLLACIGVPLWFATVVRRRVGVGGA